MYCKCLTNALKRFRFWKNNKVSNDKCEIKQKILTCEWV